MSTTTSAEPTGAHPAANGVGSGRLLTMEGLTVSSGTGSDATAIVRDVHLSIDHQSTLALVGESGSGKSLTAKSILRLIDPPLHVTGGTIDFDGADLLARSEPEMRKVRGAAIGMIFQDPMTSLNPVITVGKQLKESLRLHRGLHGKDADDVAADLLASVRIPEARLRLRQHPHHLSGGTLQRIMIAMALSCDPKLLIADEPTTALDVTVQAGILDLLRARQAATGASMLLISHDLGLVADLADDVAVMYAGRVVERQPVERIFSSPLHPYTIALLESSPHLNSRDERLRTIAGRVADATDPPPGCPFHPRCPHATERCRTEVPPTTDLADGGSVSCWLHAPGGTGTPVTVLTRVAEPRVRRSEPVAGAEPAVQAIELVKDFAVRVGVLNRVRSKPMRAVDGVSFSIPEGQTLGLVGESGCGKSTTGRLALRLLEPTSGQMFVDGEDITAASSSRLRALRGTIQMVFQDPYGSVDPRFEVRRIIAEPLRAHGRSKAECERRVTELLDLVGLPASYATRMPHQLSGGQRQRVAISRAIALEPRFLVCDEPVSALDVSIQGQIVNLLEDLQAELGLTYLFISHDLGVVRHVSDQIAVMYLGRIVEQGDAEEVYERPRHPYTRTLLDAVPVPDPERQRTRRLQVVAEVPSVDDLPERGCAFRSRCEHAFDRCEVEAPLLEVIDGHAVACHRETTPRRGAEPVATNA